MFSAEPRKKTVLAAMLTYNLVLSILSMPFNLLQPLHAYKVFPFIALFTTHHTILVVLLSISNGRSAEMDLTSRYKMLYLVLEARNRQSLWVPVKILATGTNMGFLDRPHNIARQQWILTCSSLEIAKQLGLRYRVIVTGVVDSHLAFASLVREKVPN